MPADFQHLIPIHRTRRAYRCNWCSTVIDVGGPATYVKGKYDGSFYAWHVHTDCDEAWRRDPCNVDDEGCQEEHWRGMTCAETEEAQM